MGHSFMHRGAAKPVDDCYKAPFAEVPWSGFGRFDNFLEMQSIFREARGTAAAFSHSIQKIDLPNCEEGRMIGGEKNRPNSLSQELS